MAYPTKPTVTNDDWTDGNAAKVVEPSAGLKLAGWAALDKPPFEYLNWLHWRAGQWQQYMEDVTDELKANITGEWDRIVGSGPGATDATLVAALANVTDSGQILVLEDQVVTSTLIVNVNNILIKFKGPKPLSNSGAGTGIQISTDRVTIKGGRWSGFTTAIDILTGANYCMLRDNWFTGCTTEVADADGTSDEQGSIYE